MKFNVLLVDLPWEYRNKKTGGSMKSGAAAHYQTLSLVEACQLEVDKIIQKDCALFMWATIPMLPEAMTVLKSWGFNYKTSLIWHKTGRLGLGSWFRGAAELLLVGIKGNVKAFRNQTPNVIEAPVGKHSAKPYCMYELIDKATSEIPNRKMLEMFARVEYPGWTAIGNGIDGLDIKDAINKFSGLEAGQ